jgi:2Fe-2S ferredoxin
LRHGESTSLLIAGQVNGARHCSSGGRPRIIKGGYMALLRVVGRDGVEHQVEAKVGLKVMETLRDLDYGVAAICGGMCSCATCHVYVDPEWAGRLSPPTSDERELLANLAHHRGNSRLSCQLQMSPELSGLPVTIAPEE